MIIVKLTKIINFINLTNFVIKFIINPLYIINY